MWPVKNLIHQIPCTENPKNSASYRNLFIFTDNKYLLSITYLFDVVDHYAHMG